MAEKAAALAQKEAEKAEAEAKKAAEKAAAEAKKAEEKAAAAEQKKNAARQSKIESQVIQAGGQVLKKTLLRLLKLSKYVGIHHIPRKSGGSLNIQKGQ